MDSAFSEGAAMTEAEKDRIAEAIDRVSARNAETTQAALDAALRAQHAAEQDAALQRQRAEQAEQEKKDLADRLHRALRTIDQKEMDLAYGRVAITNLTKRAEAVEGQSRGPQYFDARCEICIKAGILPSKAIICYAHSVMASEELAKLLRRYLDNHCANADAEGMSALCECQLCLDTRAALSAEARLTAREGEKTDKKT